MARDLSFGSWAMKGNAKIIGVLLLGFFCVPFMAFALTEGYRTGTVNADVEYSWGQARNGWAYHKIDPSDTYWRYQAVEIPLCKYNESGTGTVYLELRNATTTGTIVASSSVALSSVNPCGKQLGGYFLSSTTLFTLNNEVDNWDTLFLNFRYSSTNSGGTLYSQYFQEVPATANHVLTDSGGAPYQPFGGNSQVLIITTYTDPNLIYAGFNVGSSTRIIECDSWADIDCQISNAITLLFWPSQETLDEWRSLSLASTSPFGYVYDLGDVYDTVASATGTPFALTIDFSTIAPQFGSTATTGTITVFNSCAVNNAFGEFGGNAYTTYILPMLTAMMWIGLGWLIYNTAHTYF